MTPHRPGPDQAQPEGLVLVTAADELDTVEERILALRLSGEEAIQSMLYFTPPAGKRTKPIIGAGVDFVRQLTRRMNQASKGKMRLTLLEQPPIVTDFAIADEFGVLRPFVRVVVGSVDKMTGETKFAIKEVPRDSRHAATIAQEQAERKAFESHPSYNRKLVAKHIRELLKQHGVNPEDVIIAGESGSSQWAAFFAEAARKGVKRDELRAGVRTKTGKGLSEVVTAEEADRAAQAAHEIVEAATTTGSEESAAPGSPLQDAPASGPVTDSSDAAAIARLRCEEYIEKIGLPVDRVDRLWRHLKAPGDSKHPSVQRRRYDAFLQLLQALSTGMSEADALRVAVEMLQQVPQAVGEQR